VAGEPTGPDEYRRPSGPAFIRLVNTRLTGAGPSAKEGRVPSEDWMVWIEVADITDQVTFWRDRDHDDSRITWELVEYIGAPDGPNAIEVREQGLVTTETASSTATNAAVVSGVVDAQDVVVFITGQGTDVAGHSSVNHGLFTADWIAGQPVFTRGESGSVGSVSYAVVEFTGSDWRVQRPSDYNHTATTETITLDSPVDVSRTFIHHQLRTSDADALVVDLGSEAWLSSATEVSLELDPTAGMDKVSAVWVVSNSNTTPTGMRVRHYGGTRENGNNNQDLWSHDAFVPVINPQSASIMGETARTDGPDGEADKIPHGSIGLMLAPQATYTVTADVNDQLHTLEISGMAITYTSDGTGTHAEIAAGLADAINGEALINGVVSAAPDAATLVVSSDAGIAFDATESDPNLTLSQTNQIDLYQSDSSSTRTYRFSVVEWPAN